MPSNFNIDTYNDIVLEKLYLLNKDYFDNFYKDIDSNIISNSMTYVSQNNFILNDTLRNNIIYGRRINDEEYERVIHICNLDTLRNSNKLRNNMIIEEDGFNISGGGKSKINCQLSERKRKEKRKGCY